MSAGPCAQCEAHAEIHKSNTLGFGPANSPCPQCEAHAEIHAGGCGGLLFILAAAAVGSILRR